MRLPFRCLILLLVSCCALTVAPAEEITVRQGAVSITVPLPEGFVSLSPETKDFKEYYAGKLATGNEVLAVMLPPKGTPASRQLDVGTIKDLKGRDFTKEDLGLMRKTTEKNPDQVLEAAKKTSGLQRLVIEPAHDSSDRHDSFLVRDREVEGEETCAVVIFAVVRGRFWGFSVRSFETNTPEEEAELKAAAKSWASSVFAANPSDAAAQAIENRIHSKNGKGTPEREDMAHLLGSVAGTLLVVFFAVRLAKRKKASQTPPQSNA